MTSKSKSYFAIRHPYKNIFVGYREYDEAGGYGLSMGWFRTDDIFEATLFESREDAERCLESRTASNCDETKFSTFCVAEVKQTIRFVEKIKFKPFNPPKGVEEWQKLRQENT